MTNKGYLTAKSTKESDEYYTPAYAVRPLLKYLKRYCNKPQYTIWCPFDKEESQFVKVFKEAGYKVIHSHIDEDKDFFTYEPDESYDFIISNPPFSCKDEVLKRLYELKHPYAMLLPLPTLQGQKRFPYIKDCEAIIFDKRVQYYKDFEQTELSKNASFGSIYICRDFIDEGLVFEELNRE